MEDQDKVTPAVTVGEMLLFEIYLGGIAAIPWVLFWAVPFRLTVLPDIDVHVHLEALLATPWRTIEYLPQLPKEVLERLPLSIVWLPCWLGLGAFVALMTMFLIVFGHKTWLSKKVPGEPPQIFVNSSIVAWGFIALIGCFAACYTQISAEHHDCFRLAGEHRHALRHAEAAYFAITTFTTTGFGDITASSEVCRLVVAGQTLVGFLVITLLIAGFTGRVIAVIHRNEDKDDREITGDK